MLMIKKQLMHKIQQESYKDCIPNGFEFRYDFVIPNKRRDKDCANNNAIELFRCR